MIPPKPESSTWTDDQWKAIMAKGQDILVAAAAGSGKTAVLVERIINKIIAADAPINVDELLVVTFTNASAAEMKHRIGEAIEKEINNNPKSNHLRRQLSLLNRASISTLHSFCLDVIRKYYYKIDIDPGFRIADETEAQLLRDEVMDELFEEEYGKENNDSFFTLVDTFTNDRSDMGLQDIVRELFDFARSNPNPTKYLDSIVDMYRVGDSTKMEDLPFINALLYDIELQFEGAKQLEREGLELTKLPGGPAPRAENFLDDERIIDLLLAAKSESWEALYLAIQSVSFSKLKTCRGDEYDKDLVEKSKVIRNQAKKIIDDVKGELFSRRPESFTKDMKEMLPIIQSLVQLVKSFAERFDAIKKEKGLVDFADLEHFCLEILNNSTDSNTEKLHPSEAALSYQEHFKEVFVDEYQDVNAVQESILQLVTKDTEHLGNLFMVGDVKQSIYRFRLAEPNLFLTKYNRFTPDAENTGLKIDLAKNFRSRQEVLNGTNYLFKQIMGKKVGEIEYDEAAELKKGAAYPEEESHSIEVFFIDQESEETSNEIPDQESDQGNGENFDKEDLAASQLEARLMAEKIKALIQERKQIYNPKTKTSRPVMYRDMVILLRSMTWAPQIIEEFKQLGIPVYANLSTGYFNATEVAIMMSLLKVIDNPYQDIPLASVLRSPIVGLNEEELAIIRTYNRKGEYYEALTDFCKKKPSAEMEELWEKVKIFYDQLVIWRSKARQGSLSELIWELYRKTHFYDFVGGLPGGKQRQANLRALYDRARQYEETSFRGLFRFLRFIERMRERGDDLGAARALGEQEDVVRIMTIHSSKGLEFPIVFISGLARQFNMMDLRKAYLLDKDLGFAAKYVNIEKRISYPSLPQLAFKRKKKLEMLAEEMRVLYVALTRAKEKLYLISTVKSFEKKLHQWSRVRNHPEWLINEYDRAKAGSFIDWIGPALVRHQHLEVLSFSTRLNPLMKEEIINHPSFWEVKVLKANTLIDIEQEEENKGEDLLEHVFKGELIPVESNNKNIVEEQFSWKYPFMNSTNHRSKQSVSEIKRQHEIVSEEGGTELIKNFKKPILTRPRFMQEESLTPAERGTAMHLVMQHLDISKSISEESIQNQIDQMVQKELLTEKQKDGIDVKLINQFFNTELGRRMLNARRVRREVPFSLSLPANIAYPNWTGENEPVLVQGIIDCLIEDEHGTVLLDYKTDAITNRFKGGFQEAEETLEARYQVQINLYTKALEEILRRPIDERYLFFFDGAHLLKIEK